MKLRTCILRDARDTISDPDQWGQSSIESMTEPVKRCMTGAICTAAELGFIYHTTFRISN